MFSKPISVETFTEVFDIVKNDTILHPITDKSTAANIVFGTPFVKDGCNKELVDGFMTKNMNVHEIVHTTMVIDIDHFLSYSDFKQIFKNFRWFAYSSFNHKHKVTDEGIETNDRYRVVFDVSQPFTASELSERKDAIHKYFSKSANTVIEYVDNVSFSRGQVFYGPCFKEENKDLFFIEYNDGNDVIDVLSFKPTVFEQPKPIDKCLLVSHDDYFKQEDKQEIIKIIYDQATRKKNSGKSSYLCLYGIGRELNKYGFDYLDAVSIAETWHQMTTPSFELKKDYAKIQITNAYKNVGEHGIKCERQLKVDVIKETLAKLSANKGLKKTTEIKTTPQERNRSRNLYAELQRKYSYLTDRRIVSFEPVGPLTDKQRSTIIDKKFVTKVTEQRSKWEYNKKIHFILTTREGFGKSRSVKKLLDLGIPVLLGKTSYDQIDEFIESFVPPKHVKVIKVQSKTRMIAEYFINLIPEIVKVIHSLIVEKQSQDLWGETTLDVDATTNNIQEWCINNKKDVDVMPIIHDMKVPSLHKIYNETISENKIPFVVCTHNRVNVYGYEKTEHKRKYVVFFDDPVYSQFHTGIDYDEKNEQHHLWRKQNNIQFTTKQVTNDLGSTYQEIDRFIKPTDKTIGYGWDRNVMVYTTTEEITEIMIKNVYENVLRRKVQVIDIKPLGKMKVEGKDISVLPTTLTNSKNGVFVKPLLESIGYTGLLIGDAIGADNNHTVVKGKNDMIDKDIVVEISQPVPSEPYDIVRSLGVSEEYTGVVKTLLMVDKMNQSMRNRGYRISSNDTKMIVLLDKAEATRVLCLFGYWVDNWVNEPTDVRCFQQDKLVFFEHDNFEIEQYLAWFNHVKLSNPKRYVEQRLREYIETNLRYDITKNKVVNKKVGSGGSLFYEEVHRVLNKFDNEVKKLVYKKKLKQVLIAEFPLCKLLDEL